MANAKRTQKDMFGFIISALQGGEVEVSTDEMVEFLEGRIDVLSRKSANKKPSATQVENEQHKEKILEVLGGVDKVTCSEVIKLDPAFEGMSTPKMSALLNQLVGANKVVKTIDKKKSFFSLA